MSQIVTTGSTSVEATFQMQAKNENRVPSWQESLRTAIRTSRELLAELGLPNSPLEESCELDFPVFVPREFMLRMRRGDRNDPLLRQVLAAPEESLHVDGFSSDPVGDLTSQTQPGLLRKYRGRALMVLTGACAVHCRYCFRRQYPYSLVPKSPLAWMPLIDEIKADETLEEIILSGGDPLMLPDASHAWLVNQVNQIPHVRRLRIHTRMPTIVPSRICPSLLEWLGAVRVPVFIVLHINHPRELDANVEQSANALRLAGVTLLNQAVLLSGINDDPQVQFDLCEKLLDMQILPYYLHQLDRVDGAAHFEVPVDQGLRIIEFLRERLPGYGVPKYVREVAGESHKRPLFH